MWPNRCHINGVTSSLNLQSVLLMTLFRMPFNQGTWGSCPTYCLSRPPPWSYSPTSLSPACIAASHSSFSVAGLCCSY